MYIEEQKSGIVRWFRKGHVGLPIGQEKGRTVSFQDTFAEKRQERQNTTKRKRLVFNGIRD